MKKTVVSRAHAGPNSLARLNTKNESSRPQGKRAEYSLPGDLFAVAASNVDVATSARSILAEEALSLDEKARRISDLIAGDVKARGLAYAATPEQILAFVKETIVHHQAMVAIGKARGLDWSGHDVEGPWGKLNPDIAAYLARPGRDEAVIAALSAHRASRHHAGWNRIDATLASLRESAADIVNAWRMERCYKKPWSYSDIEKHVEKERREGRLSQLQVLALRDAVVWQQRLEGLGG